MGGGRVAAMNAWRLGEVSRRQGGLFTRQQAQHSGYTARQIRRRIIRGEWVHVLGQVLMPAGIGLTPARRDTAAQLAIPGSVMAGPSAARRWRLPVSDPRTFVYVGETGRSRLPQVIQWRGRPDQRDTGYDGTVPVTWRAKTIFDCARVLPEREAITLLDRALLRRWITLDDFRDRVRGHLGRKGVRQLLRITRVVGEGTRSEAERLAARLLRSHGIGGWKANAPIYDGRGLVGLGDFVWDGAKLVLEVDGLAFHQDPDRFIADRDRQNRILEAGWALIRVTWYDLTYRPEYVINKVRRHLGAR